MTNGYSTDKFILFEAVIDFAHEEDNTEEKLARLLDEFLDNAIDFVESRHAFIAAVTDVTSDAERYSEDDSDLWDDEISRTGRLIVDPDEYDDDDDEEENEDVFLSWQPEE